MSNIFHVITTISRGGAETQLLTLARQQIKFGHKVSVIYLKGEPDLKDDFTESGIEVYDFLSNKNFLLQFISLNLFLKNRNICLHAHLPRAELICALNKKRNNFVISKHNSERFFPKSPKVFSNLLAKYVFYKSDKCILISKSVKKYLIGVGDIKDNDKIFVVHYGYSDFDNNQISKTVLLPYIDSTSTVIIGTVARLTDQKDIGTLLKAYADLHQKISDSKLLIVGEGKLKMKLMKLSYDLRIENNVVWQGKTNNVYQMISSMDLFVLPSLYEGFGLVLLEAMQVGVPIVASNNSAITEVLGKNYIGLFETSNHNDLSKKMIKIIESNQNKKLMSYLTARLQIFDPSKMAKKIDLVYRSIKSEE